MSINLQNKTNLLRLQKYEEIVNVKTDQQWQNTKFKWFFGKTRKNKIKAKIYQKYKFPIYQIIEEIIEIEMKTFINDILYGKKIKKS